MSRSNLSYDIELRKFQQELFRACIAELHGGLGVLTRPLNFDHFTDAKALMLDDTALMEIICTSICRHRTWRHGSIHGPEITT